MYVLISIDRFDNAVFKSKKFRQITTTLLLHSSWIKIINNYGNCVMTPLTRVITKKTQLIRRNFAPDFRARLYLCTFKLWDFENSRTLKINNMMVCSSSCSLSCVILQLSVKLEELFSLKYISLISYFKILIDIFVINTLTTPNAVDLQ